MTLISGVTFEFDMFSATASTDFSNVLSSMDASVMFLATDVTAYSIVLLSNAGS